jgi:hypothetical protein
LKKGFRAHVGWLADIGPTQLRITLREYKPRQIGLISEELLLKPIAMYHQIHTYTELQKQIHDDLRIQHPEWVEPNGECPTCDSYEARLMELLGTSARTRSDESIALIGSSNSD